MRKYLILMGLLAIVEISLALYLTEWRHVFWDYVSNRNINGFTSYLLIFTGVALTLCVVSATTSYLGGLASIRWREKLNAKALQLHTSAIENSSQRVQQDCSDYPNLVVILGFGVVKNIVYCVVFSITLCLLFSYTYLLLLLAYAIVATLVAKIIAKPLIQLNYDSQQAEASYRNDLSTSRFNVCIDIMLSLARKTKRLNYFQVFYSQLGVIIPIVIIAPSYFAVAITFGALMQGVSIMGTILDNLSYGVNSFNDINRLLSCRKRLQELGVL